jgi:hypothetical protein
MVPFFLIQVVRKLPTKRYIQLSTTQAVYTTASMYSLAQMFVMSSENLMN